jgi:hypothetical protein
VEYIPADKGNQSKLYVEVQDQFTYARRTDFKDVSHDLCRSVEKAHGFVERHGCWTTGEPDLLAHFRQHAD